MSPAAVGMVLAAGLAHALWNTAAKTVQGHGYTFVFCYQVASALLLAPLAGWTIAARPELLGWPLVWMAGLSGLLHIGYMLTLQTGYDRAELGVVYPVARGVGPVLTMAIALLVLGERPGWLGVIGGIVIVAGIAVVTVSAVPRRAGGGMSGGAAGTGPAGGGAAGTGATGASGAGTGTGNGTGAGTGKGTDAGRRPVTSGLFWGAATGAFIAGYTLWDHHVVSQTSIPPVVYFAASTVFNSLAMAPLALRRPGQLASVARRSVRPILIVAVLSPVAYLLVLIAMQQAPVSLVAPLRETSIIIGMLLAWWLFGERGIVRRLLGAGIVIVGIGLIAFA